jgi:hypothetical protein
MNVRQLTWAALGVWLAAVFAIGTAGGFVRPPDTPPLPLLLGVTLPLAVFLAAYRGSRTFHDFVLSADLRLLTAVQAWRAGGLGFIALYTYGVLPGLFAWPAGLGDIAIGLTAPWIAHALMRDRAFAGTPRFAVWNALGILDLVVAVSLGAASSWFLSALGGGVTTTPMAQMPLVLIPTFFVPIFVMLHLTAFFQAAMTPSARRAERGAVYS